MKKKTAVISGASGFLGTHLHKQLEAEGYTVVPIPRKTLQDFTALQGFLRWTRPAVIYHLSAYGNMAHQEDIGEMVKANYLNTYNLLLASKDIAYQAFINVSTSSVTLPKETFYSATKAGAEHLVDAFVNTFDKPIVNFRPYSIYGEGEADFRFIPTVFRSCLTGEPMTLAPIAEHDWVYVDDVVHELISCAEAIGMSELFEAYECGTGTATDNRTVVDLIEKITGKKANITKEKELRSFDNLSWKAEDTNWSMTSLEDGLQKTYQFYKERYERKSL